MFQLNGSKGSAFEELDLMPAFKPYILVKSEKFALLIQ